MASGVRSVCAVGRPAPPGWRTAMRATGCWRRDASRGALRALVSAAVALLVLRSATAATDDEWNYEPSGYSASPQESVVSAGRSQTFPRIFLSKNATLPAIHTDPPRAAESTRAEPAYSSILTVLTRSAKRPQTLVQSVASPIISSSDNQTNRWQLDNPTQGAELSSSAPAATRDFFLSSGLTRSMHHQASSLSQPEPKYPSVSLHSAFLDTISIPAELWSSLSLSSSSPSSLLPSSSSSPSSLFPLRTRKVKNIASSSNSSPLKQKSPTASSSNGNVTQRSPTQDFDNSLTDEASESFSYIKEAQSEGKNILHKPRGNLFNFSTEKQKPVSLPSSPTFTGYPQSSVTTYRSLLNKWIPSYGQTVKRAVSFNDKSTEDLLSVSPPYANPGTAVTKVQPATESDSVQYGSIQLPLSITPHDQFLSIHLIEDITKSPLYLIKESKTGSVIEHSSLSSTHVPSTSLAVTRVPFVAFPVFNKAFSTTVKQISSAKQTLQKNSQQSITSGLSVKDNDKGDLIGYLLSTKNNEHSKFDTRFTSSVTKISASSSSSSLPSPIEASVTEQKHTSLLSFPSVLGPAKMSSQHPQKDSSVVTIYPVPSRPAHNFLQTPTENKGISSSQITSDYLSSPSLSQSIPISHKTTHLSKPLFNLLTQFSLQPAAVSNSSDTEPMTPTMLESPDVPLTLLTSATSTKAVLDFNIQKIDNFNTTSTQHPVLTSVDSKPFIDGFPSSVVRSEQELMTKPRNNASTVMTSLDYTLPKSQPTIHGANAHTWPEPTTLDVISTLSVKSKNSYTEATDGAGVLTLGSSGKSTHMLISKNATDSFILDYSTGQPTLPPFSRNHMLTSMISSDQSLPFEMPSDVSSATAASMSVSLELDSTTMGIDVTSADSSLFTEPFKASSHRSSFAYFTNLLPQSSETEKRISGFAAVSATAEESTSPNKAGRSTTWNYYLSSAKLMTLMSSKSGTHSESGTLNSTTSIAKALISRETPLTREKKSSAEPFTSDELNKPVLAESFSTSVLALHTELKENKAIPGHSLDHQTNENSITAATVSPDSFSMSKAIFVMKDTEHPKGESLTVSVTLPNTTPHAPSFKTYKTKTSWSSPELSSHASIPLFMTSPNSLLTSGMTLSSSPVPSSVTSPSFAMLSDLTLPISRMSTRGATVNMTHSLVTEESPKDDLSTDSEFFHLTPRGIDARENATSQMGNITMTDRAKTTSTKVVSTAASRTTQENIAKGTPQLMIVTTTNVALTTGAPRTMTSITAQLTSDRQMTMSTTEVTTSEKTRMTPRTSTTTLAPAIITATQMFKVPAVGVTTSSTSATDVPPLQCNITETIWVKTVLSVHLRRNRIDNALKQNLPKGLTQALRKAFNSSSVHAQVENLTGSSNVTVGYSVASGRTVYMASVVVEALSAYGVHKLIADIRQYVPLVQSLPIPAVPWRPSPAISLQLKTVLRFVGPGDNIKSCSFAQTMERRLESAFAEAESKVLNSHSKLTVQILASSQSTGSPAVSVIYVVWNGSYALNGTAASSLLNQLTAELVGYFLLFPPLIIAEPLEYHNLNTSIATRDYWVITVIQDVDNSSLEGNYQSFASLMEQRLAEVFVIASQQGTRFRRATTVGSYTVQMVSIRRVPGLKNPAEMTYYVQLNGTPLPGTSAAKVLSTVDSQTMALTLGYFVQLQAEPVVKNPPNNLWIIAAILAPIAVVTIIIIIITAVLCRKNKGDFKSDAMGNLNPRVKMTYRREASYYHQPVQGFDYAKQHLGQHGGDEEALPVTQETIVLPLPIRDAPLSQERGMHQDGSTSKKTLSSEIRKSRLPSEDGSVISNESGKLNSGRGSSAQKKVTAQQKMTKEETRKRSDPYDTSSGSLQLISTKPMTAPPSYSHPASSDRSQDSAIVNGEQVSVALKQKSDIEHYRNKLRLKAKRKGYYDFPAADSGRQSSAQRQRHSHGKDELELSKMPNAEEEKASTYIKSRRRHSQLRNPVYRSRQSLNSPSPGGTEMDLLVMREKPRRGIRNSGYDTEPELIEETNVDRLVGPRICGGGRQVKGHSDTSTLSSQPSIDEVRQQMHLLLEEAFSLASAGHSTGGRHHHHHPHGPYGGSQSVPYSEVVTSAPGTMNRSRGGLQWVPAYKPDAYQCSLPKPAFRFTQLPDMAMGSPPPPIPPRTGPASGASLRRSSSDIGPKARVSESSGPETQNQRDSTPYLPMMRTPLPAVATDLPMTNYSGNPMSAVYAIPANRPGYMGYLVSTPPTSYRSPSWMSYPPEPEDLPSQWADSVPLPGYAEAFPHPHYPQGSPPRLPRQYSQASSSHSAPDNPPTPSTAASQQSLTGTVDTPDTSLSSLSTAALVKAIREEVAKLAKKQTDMFEFQV